MFKDSSQKQMDADRKYYELLFPADMSDKAIHAFIRSIGKNLRGGSTLSGVPTMIFELWSSPAGITHRLRVPSDAARYVIGQLQSALPGIDVRELISDNEAVDPLTDRIAIVTENPHVEDAGFQFGATLHMANSGEELPIVNPIDYSHRILASMQDATADHDTICIQWVIAHSNNQKLPASDRPLTSNRTSFLYKMIVGDHKAGRDEVSSRRQKQFDQVYIATGRVAARGKTEARAEQLVRQVVRAYTSEGGYAHFWAKGAKPWEISEDIRIGKTPFALTAQLNVKELSSVIGWPMDDRYVTGLSRDSSRPLPASEGVAQSGLELGVSSVPGSDRKIAVDMRREVSHFYIGGATGTGKTTLTVNLIRQILDNNGGLVLLERDGNLYRQALNQIPPERAGDVICIDLSDPTNHVGLNLLRLNRPDIVAGQLAALLDALYPEHKSIFAHQLVLHGIPVLANLERATVADLLTLVHPRNPAEKAWALAAVQKMKDKTYRDFWLDWYKDERQIQQNAQALKNRMWDLLTPEPTRYLLNQETSSFDPADVISGNKILLVNLAGASPQAASLIGTMLVTALWTAAKAQEPDRPNFLVMDEFHQFAHLSHDVEDMFAEARKRNLGLIAATQYIERLDRGVRKAIMANARNKVIFTSSVESADIHSKDFAHPLVSKDSFINLKQYQAIARLNGTNGVTPPVSLKTFPAPDGYNRGRWIQELSRRQHGRTIEQIHQDESTRRVVEHQESETKRKPIGSSTYEIKEK